MTVPVSVTVEAVDGARGLDQFMAGPARLVGFSLATQSVSDGPVLATVRVGRAGRNLALRRGWIRGSGIAGQRVALTWSGDHPIDRETQLEVDFTNNTGATVTVVLTYQTEPIVDPLPVEVVAP